VATIRAATTMHAKAGFSLHPSFRLFQQYLREADGWSRRKAAIAGRARRRSQADERTTLNLAPRAKPDAVWNIAVAAGHRLEAEVRASTPLRAQFHVFFALRKVSALVAVAEDSCPQSR
jgi:hypothetical protein